MKLHHYVVNKNCFRAKISSSTDVIITPSKNRAKKARLYTQQIPSPITSFISNTQVDEMGGTLIKKKGQSIKKFRLEFFYYLSFIYSDTYFNSYMLVLSPLKLFSLRNISHGSCFIFFYFISRFTSFFPFFFNTLMWGH